MKCESLGLYILLNITSSKVVNQFQRRLIMSDFEEYIKKKLEENKEMIGQLPYSSDQLREIYRQEYEYKKNPPALELNPEGQAINREQVEFYLPEKWEMPREGKLLYDDEELLNALKLIIFNIGVKKLWM